MNMNGNPSGRGNFSGAQLQTASLILQGLKYLNSKFALLSESIVILLHLIIGLLKLLLLNFISKKSKTSDFIDQSGSEVQTPFIVNPFNLPSDMLLLNYIFERQDGIRIN